MKATEKDIARFKKDIQSLLANDFPPSSDDEIFRDMLFNIAKLRNENLDTLEIRLLNTAFKELRYAIKIFKPYRSVPKAAVFGSARTKPNKLDYKMAEAFGRLLVKKGWMVITGGASGIMEAAMIGAGAEHSFGLNIMLPFEQQPNWIIKDNMKLINFKYFFTRKLMFLKESEATVLFPGGFGTFDEGFESFTLVQTGKAKPRPLVMVDSPGSDYWKGLIRLIRKNLLEEGLISPNDMNLFRHFQDNEEAAAEILNFYKNYDSSRFLRDKYLIRLKRPISDADLKNLSAQYKDMFVKSGIERLADPAEDDNRDPSLERIVFHFDRSSYSRLRQLIDSLNQLPKQP